MKIGFPVQPGGPGGTKTWLGIFSQYCQNHGHEVTYGHEHKVDAFVTLANYSPKTDLIRLKEEGTKIIYRMDGIYFDYVSDNPITNQKFNQGLIDSLKCTDFIIYQSKYCKKMASFLTDSIKKKPSKIIYNGADTHHFTPNGSTLERTTNKKVILSIAYWGTYNMAKYSMDHIEELAKELLPYKDIELWILGLAYTQIEEDLIQAHLPNITKINLHDPISRELMPMYLRSADLILHIRPNDACSNLIIEAMTTGIPIVGLDLGSTPELLGNAGLVSKCKPSWSDFPVIDIQDLKRNILATFKKHAIYKKRIIKRGRLFTADKMCAKYMDVISLITESE